MRHFLGVCCFCGGDETHQRAPPSDKTKNPKLSKSNYCHLFLNQRFSQLIHKMGELLNECLGLNGEDEEMQHYTKSSINVVNFKMVYNEADLDATARKSNFFQPDMAHQVFGDTEMIFGYRHLNIDIYYLHNSARCYVDVQASGKLHETELLKADDVIAALNPWLPENYRQTREEFLKDINDEEHDTLYGEIIGDFEGEKDKQYKITACNLADPKFREFHQRFETLIVWFIDGANLIDLEDPRWAIFYVYEDKLDEATNKIHRSPVAFCTVYKFYLYPNSIRPRISQFLVLPTHQRKGIAKKLYSAVFNYLKALPEVEDITVEEPTEIFQQVRDYCDSLDVYTDLKEDNIAICTKNQKQITAVLKKHKICKRQTQRVFDVLECLTAHKNGYEEYVKFTESIKKRITDEIKKQTNGSKRLCTSERNKVNTDPIDDKTAIEAEYNKYINSLEWPVNRLRNHIK